MPKFFGLRQGIFPIKTIPNSLILSDRMDLDFLGLIWLVS